MAPAGFTTAEGFAPHIPTKYYEKAHACKRVFYTIKSTTPFGINMRVDGAHVLVDLYWYLSQPYVNIHCCKIVEIPPHVEGFKPNFKVEFEKHGVKYLENWTVRRRYGSNRHV
jgi:hypothetical protein